MTFLSRPNKALSYKLYRILEIPLYAEDVSERGSVEVKMCYNKQPNQGFVPGDMGDIRRHLRWACIVEVSVRGSFLWMAARAWALTP